MLARISTLALAFFTAVSATPAVPNRFTQKQSANNPTAKLLSKARTIRALEDGGDAEEADVDLTNYSIKFMKCQFVKAFSDDLAEEGAETVLATDRFIVFRLCLTAASSCSSGYGEYVVDMDTYLGYTVEYKQEEQENMCQACDENCYYAAADDEEAEEEEEEEEQDEDEDGDERRLKRSPPRNGRMPQPPRKLADAANAVTSDCTTCVDDCAKIDAMEENYYMDATNFINCQQLDAGNDDGGVELYAGPMCGSQGSKIKIGVFTDEDCMFLDSSLDVEDYLADEDGAQYKLSHALLKTTYDNSDPISCKDDEEDDGNNNYYQQAETREICRNVYEASGKCESSYDFAQYSEMDSEQIANEELVCAFISSLNSGTYSQDGEIVVGGNPTYTPGGTSTTGGQKFALTFFILGTVGLAVYAAMLHSQLTKGGKADLSTQGGAMA